MSKKCGECGTSNNDINAYCVKCKAVFGKNVAKTAAVPEKPAVEVHEKPVVAAHEKPAVDKPAVKVQKKPVVEVPHVNDKVIAQGADKAIEEFLSKDKIDLLKFKANYEILNNGTADQLSKPEIIKHSTSSIENLSPIVNRPIGYPTWFVAGYPDVVNWLIRLEPEKIEMIFVNFSENAMFDKNRLFNSDILRRIIGVYIESGNKLECGAD